MGERVLFKKKSFLVPVAWRRGLKVIIQWPSHNSTQLSLKQFPCGEETENIKLQLHLFFLHYFLLMNNIYSLLKKVLPCIGVFVIKYFEGKEVFGVTDLAKLLFMAISNTIPWFHAFLLRRVE